MDHRLYFVVGDFIANLLVGALVGLLSWLIVGPGWNMWIGMLAMMPTGMVVGLACFFPAGIKLGAMEAMVPMMYSGMMSGMFAGMLPPMMPTSAALATAVGAACGAVTIILIWIVNSLLRGVSREGMEG